MAAIGQAAKYGVIIKSGEALERMGKVNTIAFDKTGTLTQGSLVVSDVVLFDKDMSENDFLSLAASVESHSEHPLGKAVVAHAKQKNIKLQAIEKFKMIPGKGIGAEIDGRKVLCGSSSYLQENAVVLGENADTASEKFRRQGKYDPGRRLCSRGSRVCA
jgi:P-type E1-E2 ATPase